MSQLEPSMTFQIPPIHGELPAHMPLRSPELGLNNVVLGRDHGKDLWGLTHKYEKKVSTKQVRFSLVHHLGLDHEPHTSIPILKSNSVLCVPVFTNSPHFEVLFYLLSTQDPRSWF